MKIYLFLLMLPFLATCATDDDSGIIEPPNGNGNGNNNGIQYTVVDPCLTSTEDCLENLRLRPPTGGLGIFSFYRNYPILNDTAVWGNIRNAVIAIHGMNRDADNYFDYMVNSVGTGHIADSTLIISPRFPTNVLSDLGEFHWFIDYREGALSGNLSSKLSSFSALDSLIAIISNKEQFPFLKNIILTGHSSGALMVHAYALATNAEELFGVEIDYIVANSQYFYYPQDLRYDPDTQTFTAPEDCDDFDHWPLGFAATNEYIGSASRETLNEKFVQKRITYLLGTNDTVTTGTLNTSDCSAVLLGVHRFNRGENIHLFMETFYPGEHNHQKIEVPNIGHSGNGMYQSNAYKTLMNEILTRHR